jgi:hypothetical protein
LIITGLKRQKSQKAKRSKKGRIANRTQVLHLVDGQDPGACRVLTVNQLHVIPLYYTPLILNCLKIYPVPSLYRHQRRLR